MCGASDIVMGLLVLCFGVIGGYVGVDLFSLLVICLCLNKVKQLGMIARNDSYALNDEEVHRWSGSAWTWSWINARVVPRMLKQKKE
jgi:hypothetical protein